eukprot:g5445.t1
MCETCGKNMDDCIGHFGHVELAKPVFHLGYFNHIKVILQSICKKCARVLLSQEDQVKMRARVYAVTSNYQREVIQKLIDKECKKKKECPHCYAFNGNIRKVTGSKGLRLVHEVYKEKRAKNQQQVFLADIHLCSSQNEDIEQNKGKAQDDMNPVVVYDLFKRIPLADLDLLNLQPSNRPEKLVLTHVLVPPVCIRPSVQMAGGASNESDLTVIIQFILEANAQLRNDLNKGAATSKVYESWENLTSKVADLFNGSFSASKVKKGTKPKPMRGLCQRLKGKEGRFRGNLSGKRVNF